MPLAASLLDIQYEFALRWSYLSAWGQFYRIPLNGLVYTDQVRAVIAALLFYEFRGVERALGTNKFKYWALKVWGACTCLMPLAAAVAPGNPLVAPGSTALLVALAIAYKRITPPVFLYSINGVVTITDKALLWLLVPNLWDQGVWTKAVLGAIFGVAFGF